jgi:hypothetical protein
MGDPCHLIFTPILPALLREERMGKGGKRERKEGRILMSNI